MDQAPGSYMPPSSPPNDAPNHRLGYAVGLAEIALSDAPLSITKPNSPNIGDSETRGMVVFATPDGFGMGPRTMLATCRNATLGNHVSHVIRIGSQKQVNRIAARRVVTAVTHEETIRDGASDLLPSEAVRVPTSIASAQIPITLGQSSQPRPASARAASGVNLGPESLVSFHISEPSGPRWVQRAKSWPHRGP